MAKGLGEMNRIKELWFEKQHRFGNFISALLLVICIFGLVSAIQFGNASLDYYRVRNMILMWNKGGSDIDEVEFTYALEWGKNASSLHSSHPLYHDVYGQVIEWGVVAGLLPQTSLEEAKESYIHATELRPTWPVTWASLALIKWRNGEIDDEFWNYAYKAHRLGPMQPEIHSFFSKIGLSFYIANDPNFVPLREITRERLLKGLLNPLSRNDILRFIDETDSRPIVCRWFKNESKYISKDILNCV